MDNSSINMCPFLQKIKKRDVQCRNQVPVTTHYVTTLAAYHHHLLLLRRFISCFSHLTQHKGNSTHIFKMALPAFVMDTPLHSSFDQDIRDTHLLYDYNARDANGNPEKWRYEMWFFNENRIVYAIHGGPMAGRINVQTCQYQCIRPGELWQCSWLEYVSVPDGQ